MLSCMKKGEVSINERFSVRFGIHKRFVTQYDTH